MRNMKEIIFVSLLIGLVLLTACFANSSSEPSFENNLSEVATVVRVTRQGTRPSQSLPLQAESTMTPLPATINLAPSPTQTAVLITYCYQIDCAEGDTDCSYEGCECTELGCGFALQFQFANTLPYTYMVEIINEQEHKLILHCFEPEELKSYSSTLEEFILRSSPDVKRVTQFSPAPQMCGQDEEGIVGMYVKSDGTPDMILVSCQTWTDEYFRKFIRDTDCHRGEDFSTFSLGYSGYPDEYIPEEMTMIVHWDTYSKTIELPLEYETYQPNGSACEPTCSKANYTIELP